MVTLWLMFCWKLTNAFRIHWIEIVWITDTFNRIFCIERSMLTYIVCRTWAVDFTQIWKWYLEWPYLTFRTDLELFQFQWSLDKFELHHMNSNWAWFQPDGHQWPYSNPKLMDNWYSNQSLYTILILAITTSDWPKNQNTFKTKPKPKMISGLSATVHWSPLKSVKVPPSLRSSSWVIFKWSQPVVESW